MAKKTDEELTPEEQEAQEEKVEDLATGLMQAKKKPRNFAIVAAGNDVLSMLVQKKDFRDGPLRQERRDEGGKQIYEGVCQGVKGTVMRFEFEGDLPKFKPGKLRRFIAEQTGMVVTPEFAKPGQPPSASSSKPKK